MAYYVYLLACIKDGQFTNFYTGHTNDVYRRVKQHIGYVMEDNTKHYTGRFDAVRHVWTSRAYSTRSEAAAVEQEVKYMNWSEKMRLIREQ